MSYIPSTERPHLVIVGKATGAEEEKYEKELTEYSRKFNLNKFIHFVGYRQNPASIIKSCDALVLISDNEPFGRVVAEAQGVGVPVVGAMTGGIPEVLDNRLGRLVNADDANDIAKGIRQVLAQKYSINLRTKVANNIVCKFDTEKYRDEIIKVFNILNP